MPSVKISQLPKIVSIDGTEVILAIQNGTSKSISLTDLFSDLKSQGIINFDVQTSSMKITNGATNILVCDGSTNSVAVGSDQPLDKFHVYGNIKVGTSATYAGSVSDYNSANPGSVVGAVEYIGSGSLTNEINSSCDTTSISVSADRSFALTNGLIGQQKTIILSTIGGLSKAIVNPKDGNGLGWSSVSLSNIGSSVTFKYVNAKWIVVGSYLAAITP